MNVNHTTYIKNLLYSFLDDTSIVGEKIMFVKHYNTLNMSLEDIEKVVGESYKKGFLYHRYFKNDIKEPYEPLINGIRYYYQKLFSSEMSVAEFVDNCNVYSLHKEIFVSYLTSGVAKRTEPIITAEVQYEMQKFVDSIINCLNYISKKTKLLIVLDRFQQSPLSTINVILQIIDEMHSSNIKILIIYNESESPLKYIEKSFNKIINIAEEKNILFEWEEEHEIKIRDYHSGFILNKRFFGDYLIKLNNLYNMIAAEDAKYYTDVINTRISEDKLRIDDNDKFSFYGIRALCDILCFDDSGALLACEKMLPLFNLHDNPHAEYKYNYICGVVQTAIGQSDMALKYVKKCMKIANKLNSENMKLYAEILKQEVQFGAWRDVFAVNFEKIVPDKEFYEKLDKHGFKNTLAYCMIFAYDNDSESVRNIVEGKESQTYIEAIRIGNELQNSNFLLSAYTKYIVIFTDKGYLKYTDKYYNEKLKIISREENKQREAHLFMGMGYNCIICEQFIRANEYFSKAIEILYSLNNPEAIVEALYNMSVNALCAQDYLSSRDYLNTVFKMLDNLQIETIQICNASKLHGMLALSYYMLGNEYRCYKCLSNMETYMTHLLYPEEGETPELYHWYEDLFLYYLINGILSKNNGEYDAAHEYFKKADECYDNYSGALFYGLQNYIVECYDLYIKCNEHEKAMEILEKGFEQCNKYGYTLKYQNIMLMIEGKVINARPLMGEFSLMSMSQLIEMSKNKGIEKQLTARKKDIAFLSSLQELLNKDDVDCNTLINSTMNAMQNSFNLDSMLILKKENNDIEEAYRNVDYYNDFDYNKIFSFMNVIKTEFLANRINKSFTEFNKIVKMFGRNRIVTLVGVPIIDEKDVNVVFLAAVNMHNNFRRNRTLLMDNDLSIIKTAIIQLESSVKRIKNRNKIIEMNERLNTLAVTDMLTGLYNRQGFSKKIEENLNCCNSIYILYADLDNFKYYNDTFGHDLGDMILVEFAKIFQNSAKNMGYAVRYGGDEFLVVLNNVSKDKVCQAADNIYESIRGGFVNVVSEYVNKDVVIPDNKLVSCSIGIASAESCSVENVKQALQKADEALYYMKKNCKGSYIMWEDIHE